MELIDKIPVGMAEDFTGRKIGRLIVLYRIKNNGKTRGAKWRCECSCGNTVDVLASNLKRNHTLSCGCLQKESVFENKFIDETGHKYGRLKVLQRSQDYISPSGGHRVIWKCQCDCGQLVDVDGTSLRSGRTISCGCYRLEKVANRSNDVYIGKTFHYITILNKTNEKYAEIESLWKCKCNLCGSIITLPTARLKTQISCGCLRDSYGVSIIKELLDNNNILYETEKTFHDCIFPDTKRKARFDFYINSKYIIEFDGPQHSSHSGGWNTKEQMIKTQEHDIYKNIWCQNNHIPIIRIPYTIQDKIKIEDLLLETSDYVI